MAGCDRLSNLSDDLLRRILYFAPAKEAASTSVLSRRWRSLWRSSGAVNLAVRVRDENQHYYSERSDGAFLSRRDAFVLSAVAALAAADCSIRRLTFHLEAGCADTIRKFLYCYRHRSECHDVLDAVLSDPASRLVEELCVAAVDPISSMSFDDEVSKWRVGIYQLSLCSLPSETLRVLDLTNCSGLTPPAPAFPRLASLRLRRCHVPLEDLQGIIDAAPELATVHLESVLLAGTDDAPRTSYDAYPLSRERMLCLRFPAATALVLEKCGWTENGRVALELDAPRLRCFRYEGYLRQFRLKSEAPDMALADLHFFQDQGNKEVCALFWRFVQNFSNAKALKLKVSYLKHIAVVGEGRQAKLLCAFPNLERLELEGVHRPGSKNAAVAVANLLRCCPVVRDLRIKLSTVPRDSLKNAEYSSCFLERKYQLDLDKSVDQFMSRRTKPKVAMDGDDGDNYDEVPGIPGLSGHSFDCLQSCLRRVSLQFRLDKSNCFGVQLLKFFAENAMVLEEMRIDSGNRRISDHMNHRFGRWIANSSSIWQKDRLNSLEMSNPPSAGLKVLPLER